MLDRRALGRATLHRQLLLTRHDMTAHTAVEHLVAMQSQLVNPPYLGLWSRLHSFELSGLTELMEKRQIVRCCLLRATLHVVSAEDFLWLRPVLQPALERAQRGFFRRDTEGMDMVEFTEFTTELLEEAPRTNVELREAFAQRYPDRNATSLMHSVQFFVPTVYVPPGGTWGKGGSVPMTTARSWLGKPLGQQQDPGPLVLRYLAAFGPATLKDIQAWSGLTRLKPVLDELRPRLHTDVDETGGELFDLPDAPRPGADVPAPVRFVPDYDNLLVAHADRTRVISDEHRKVTHTSNGMVAATVLVDGAVRGRWRIERKKDKATMQVEMFEKTSKKDLAQVEREGMRLLAFAAAEAKTLDYQLT
jgi:hypothetical protein